jgi:hypothetical protein
MPGIGWVSTGCLLKRLSGGGERWIAIVPWWGIPGQEWMPEARAKLDQFITQPSRYGPVQRLKACIDLMNSVGLQALPEASCESVAESGQVLLHGKKIPLGQLSFQRLKGEPIKPTLRTHLFCVSECYSKDELKHYIDSLTGSIQEFGIQIRPKYIEFDRFAAELNQLDSAKVKQRSIVLVGVPGSREYPRPIGPDTLAALDRMDALSIPYRIFGEPSLHKKYAATISAAYHATLLGTPLWGIELPSMFKDTLFIGVDLGHPHHKGDSVPVFSIVNSRGHILAWWRGSQVRDETVRRETVSKATDWILEWLQGEKLKVSDFVILRDGKINKNDCLEDLARHLPAPALVVEVVKKPVPLITDRGQVTAPGTWIEVVPGRDGFLQPPDPPTPSQLAHPIRLRVSACKTTHTLKEIAGAVFTLCHAPSLGLRPLGSPSPIYWSDGLAANGGHDLQFRGMNHVPHYDEIRSCNLPSTDLASLIQKASKPLMSSINTSPITMGNTQQPQAGVLRPIVVTESAGHFLLRLPSGLADRARKIDGRQWDGERKMWVYPKTPESFDALAAEFKAEADVFAIRRPNAVTPKKLPGIAEKNTGDEGHDDINTPEDAENIEPRSEFLDLTSQLLQGLQDGLLDQHRMLNEILGQQAEIGETIARAVISPKAKSKEIKLVPSLPELLDVKKGPDLALFEKAVISVAYFTSGNDQEFMTWVVKQRPLHAPSEFVQNSHELLKQQFEKISGSNDPGRSFWDLVWEIRDKQLIHCEKYDPVQVFEFLKAMNVHRNRFAHSRVPIEEGERLARAILYLLNLALVWTRVMVDESLPQ